MTVHISDKDLNYFLEKQEGPCLSLYQPTHRSHPDNEQDPIQFKNLVKELEDSLKQKYSNADVSKLLAPFHALADNREFWQKQTLDGLAILADQQSFTTMTLQRQPKAFAVVADSFHLKPLLRLSQTQDNFQVLCVSRSEVQMYEGNRDGLDRILFDNDFPESLEDLDGIEDATDGDTATYRLTPSAKQSKAMSYTSPRDVAEADKERFLGAVARALHNDISKNARLPVVIVGLAENIGTFKKFSQNPYVLDEDIAIDPSTLSVDQLRDKAWAIVEPVARKRAQDEISRFNQAHGTGLASDNPNDALAAILEGRVDTLLVDADKRIAGVVDREAKKIDLHENFSSPEAEDILDDLAEMVIRRGGQVKVLPSEYMPTESGLAAIYRY